MSMEEKRTSAMRIFEALSGVDEELLIKAEDDVAVAKVPSRGKIVAFGKSRYAGTIVAVACVVVVCLALWRTGGYQYATKESAADGAAPAAVAEAALEAAPEEVQEELGKAELADAEESVNAQSSSKLEDLEGEIAKCAETESLTDSSVISGSQPCLKYPYTEITVEEAIATAQLGDYVPTLLPAGYAWESGSADIVEETGECRTLYLTWTRGLDFISITITKADSREVQLTEIEETEGYNVHLYEIPYADTVPEKYYESFHQPVFAEEDFTREIVEMRMKVISDAGDTDTPRGDFSVFYQDGILVRFNGRGTAEEIWEMFQSME